MLLDDLYAFYLEHRRCGELDGGVEGRASLDDLHVRGEDWRLLIVGVQGAPYG